MEMEGAPGGMGCAIKELMKASCRRMWYYGRRHPRLRPQTP
jgi:hypothetical protein